MAIALMTAATYRNISFSQMFIVLRISYPKIKAS